MKKSLAASQDIMKNYLSELLTDDEEDIVQQKVKRVDTVTEKVEKKRLETLLKNVSSENNNELTDLLVTSKSKANVEQFSNIKPKSKLKQESLEVKRASTLKEAVPLIFKNDKVNDEINQKIQHANNELLSTRKSQGIIPLVEEVDKQKNYRQGSFQAMFFDVAGLTVAVPLIELGGIHNIDKINSLLGKPAWFKGVMLNRDSQINVVDTARWVMPEKCDEALIDSLVYQYIIMLGDSAWGLTAENLVDTVILEQDDVKWLNQPSKRPWLAGLVKDRMCALLEVDSLIKLFDEGAGIV